jgi:hypothetical protein
MTLWLTVPHLAGLSWLPENARDRDMYSLVLHTLNHGHTRHTLCEMM